jgi:type IV secretion system protein VirB9
MNGIYRDLLLTLVAAMLFSAPGAANSQASGVRTETVRPGTVTELVGVPGFITTIEFGAGERIENIAIGDGSLWQVTPNRRGNLVFVKPIAGKGTTNMTVVTDQHLYNFLLVIDSKVKAKAVFFLRMRLPEELTMATSPQSQPAKVETVTRSASKYTYNGSAKLVPADVFDDGVSTYFKFQSTTDLPAIFVSESPKTDIVVNTAFRDDYIVVDQLARQFVLRRGNEATFIVNGSFTEPAAGPDSPRFQKGSKY